MFFVEIFGDMVIKPYLCIVFFIVLDLRLTRLEYSGTPFFVPVCFCGHGFKSVETCFLRVISRSVLA